MHLSTLDFKNHLRFPRLFFFLGGGGFFFFFCFHDESTYLVVFFSPSIIFASFSCIVSTTFLKMNTVLSESVRNTTLCLQVVALPVLLYGCTTWTLIKHPEKKLHGNHAQILPAVLNKSWKPCKTAVVWIPTSYLENHQSKANKTCLAQLVK